VQPLIADIYFRAGYLPIKDIPGGVRFFGALSAMAFIIAIVLVLATRKLVGRKLMESHMARFFLFLPSPTWSCASLQPFNVIS
jgi:hypothetical protein